jgi:hypothetical protein
MTMRLTIVFAIAGTILMGAAAAPAHPECPLDHYFLLQEDGQLAVDKRRIYRHGDPAEGYYPLTWSPVYGCWSFGEPGFSDTSDPAYGFAPEVQLVGTPNVDYQIWLEIVDISPDLYVQTDDGTWLTEIGDTYNLSDWPEHHVHMQHRAYVPQNPPPECPFYVAYRLVDELGPYGSTPPFSVVFNAPAPTVEATTPEYGGLLAGLAHSEIAFVFHRPITVEDGPPVTITDAATQTQDYYTGYFDDAVSPDGLTLTLTQIGPALPGDTALQTELTEHVRDAAEPWPAAIPFTLCVSTPIPGDLDLDGDVDLGDLGILLAHYGMSGGATYGDGDISGDGAVDLSDLGALLANYGTGG